MKRSRFTDEDIALAVQRAALGSADEEIAYNQGISRQTTIHENKQPEGPGAADLRRLRQLEEENRELKHLVADLCLDKRILQNALSNEL